LAGYSGWALETRHFASERQGVSNLTRLPRIVRHAPRNVVLAFAEADAAAEEIRLRDAGARVVAPLPASPGSATSSSPTRRASSSTS